MDKRRVPTGLLMVALFQAVAVLPLPPEMYAGIDPVFWVVGAAVFALLGLNLVRLRDWARVASVFVQGFNIIVRLLTLVSNVVPYGPEPQLNTTLAVASLFSMLLSGLVLYLIEQPDIQLVMQQ